MTSKIKSKSDRILTSVKLWFLLPLPCKITVFTAQNPSKNEIRSLQKNTLQPDPPKIVSFPSRATLDGIMNRKGFQKGPQNRASRAANFLWKSMILGGPPPSLPKSPKASISEALLINFEPFLAVRIHFYRLVSVLSAPAPAMIRNDSITVWRISAEINCYFVKRSRLDPIRNFPTKSVKPKAVNSNPRHEHKFSQCLHSCLGDVMSPSLSVRSSSPLPASRSNWQDESLSSTPNARTHDNCICFVYSWTLFVSAKLVSIHCNGSIIIRSSWWLVRARWRGCRGPVD